MASRFEEDAPEVKECANCGSVEGLMRCSRCRSVYFCSVKCQKAYWPFHKASCRRNEFADIVEQDDPKFAKWMRKHGKLATLKDDEVERLERARSAVSGPGVDEVMHSMFNRVHPKPRSPSYSAEEIKLVEATQHRLSNVDPWMSIDTSFGMDCTTYKWRQNLSHIELFVKLPRTVDPQRVDVVLESQFLSISWEELPSMEGALAKEIISTESYWFINDGILHVCMLKRSRKGHYLTGQTNADTFWKKVLLSSHSKETLKLVTPPTEYYSSPYEANDMNSENHLMSREVKRHAQDVGFHPAKMQNVTNERSAVI